MVNMIPAMKAVHASTSSRRLWSSFVSSQRARGLYILVPAHTVHVAILDHQYLHKLAAPSRRNLLLNAI
jgi:hypothetical protein